MGCGCTEKAEAVEYPTPRRSSKSRAEAGIYVPTHMDTPERWPRPKWISRLFRPPRGRLFTIPIIWSGSPCSPITETGTNNALYPSSTVSDGGWESQIHSKIDVGTDAEVGSTDATMAECPSEENFALCDVHIEDPVGTPASSDCQGMRILTRHRATDQPNCGDVTMRLFEGTTARTGTKSVTLSGLSQITFTYTLTDGELDAIGDHDNMRMKMGANIGANEVKTQSIAVEMAWARIEYFPN